ncbi:hypothetical protein [Pseudarthrobacter sp. PH31-O2]|uniref:hypothetical protein n=1 Tax=Pseudarthrobacter sp. PH31-O2 TaxID=3046206 RepID=UPI0024B93E5B|nr:hypothetical protein [Pseudarthrobacter sp. PH31-O2]MDJ0352295.1 hypothetical protein [Pseudarthrobacter sp. PH31-O2]
MTGNETTKSSTSGAEPDGRPQAGPKQGKGIKSRLTDAQKEMLASKSRGGAGSQSVGHSHKPTHVSGKQGPAEKKVRW